MPTTNASSLAQAVVDKRLPLDQVPLAQRSTVAHIISNGGVKPTKPVTTQGRMAHFRPIRYRARPTTPPTAPSPSKNTQK